MGHGSTGRAPLTRVNRARKPMGHVTPGVHLARDAKKPPYCQRIVFGAVPFLWLPWKLGLKEMLTLFNGTRSSPGVVLVKRRSQHCWCCHQFICEKIAVWASDSVSLKIDDK